MLQRVLLLFVFVLCAAGIAHAQTPTTSAQNLVDQVSEGARSKRDDARALRALSQKQLGARDYDGAMKSRWQMLGIGDENSTLGLLTSYAIQSLALDDIQTIAAHLDAASARRYAAQLLSLDAQTPTYAAILQAEKAANLRQLDDLTRDPAQWQKAIQELGFSEAEQKILQRTPIAQIKRNIETVYQKFVERSKQPYSFAEINISTDPYTALYATPFALERFGWTRAKTQRLLIVAALRARADRLEKHTASAALPLDPFGSGPLRLRNGVIYSVGPDAKDDGGKPLSARVLPTDQGDLVAPQF